VTGLNAGDQIIQDPPDSLVEGQRVTVVHPRNINPGGSGAPTPGKATDESEGGI
jgi:hypothetical protein